VTDQAPDTAWTDLGSVAELLSAGHLDGEVDGYPATVVRIAGRLHAFEDRCTHDGESLAGAEIEPGAAAPVVVCPRHGARFCLLRGEALSPPAYEPIRIFAVRERAGRIEVGPSGA
jgi:3-phenylpropionate/trans-cinnamate dioxygenase ferredoxin subunit